MFALERSRLSWRLQFWQLSKQAACFNLAAAASSTFSAAATAAEVFLTFHIGGQRQHHQLRCSSISIQRPRSNNSPFCYASNSDGAACSGGSASLDSSSLPDSAVAAAAPVALHACSDKLFRRDVQRALASTATALRATTALMLAAEQQRQREVGAPLLRCTPAANYNRAMCSARWHRRRRWQR